jgi:hypothetical protein
VMSFDTDREVLNFLSVESHKFFPEAVTD